MEQHTQLRHSTAPSLDKANQLLLQAREYLCAGCKRDCERRLTQFGQVPQSCRRP